MYIEGLTQNDDFFWNIINISIWSTIEAGACIVAGCLATLRPLMKSALHQARGSNTVSSCAQHISRSLRSTHRSNEHLQESSVPRLDVALSEMDHKYFDGERKSSQPGFITMPSYAESIARPDSAVTPFASDIGNKKRGSADPILKRTESNATDTILREKERKTSQPTHMSWALHRKHSSEDVINGRPTSAPVSPSRYREAGDAV